MPEDRRKYPCYAERVTKIIECNAEARMRRQTRSRMTKKKECYTNKRAEIKKRDSKEGLRVREKK
jgi:hypothetical protein